MDLDDVQELDQLQHSCDDYKEIRVRVHSNDSRHIVYQCVFCGEQKGQNLSKKYESEASELFDDILNEKFIEKRQEFLVKTEIYKSDFEKSKEKDEYDIIKIINSYEEKYGNESAFNFMRGLLRKERESKSYEYKTEFYDEEKIKLWFKNNFNNWFEIYEEISGNGFVNNNKSNIRIDFIIFPKKELLEVGYPEIYIGVEAKYINPQRSYFKKLTQTVFQALSYWYSGSKWRLGGKVIKLSGVVLVSNLSFSDEANCFFKTYDRLYLLYHDALLNLANHANVGFFNFNRSRDKSLNSWAMKFSSANFCRWDKGKGFSKININVIGKERIGNIS